jgi:DNA-binding transcriptional ArsR family regulator
VSTDVFRALADPTRRQILLDLKGGELAAGQIGARFPISGPSISRHLSVLKSAGLVTERRDANRILYSLVADRLALSVGGFLSVLLTEPARVGPGGTTTSPKNTARPTGIEAPTATEPPTATAPPKATMAAGDAVVPGAQEQRAGASSRERGSAKADKTERSFPSGKTSGKTSGKNAKKDKKAARAAKTAEAIRAANASIAAAIEEARNPTEVIDEDESVAPEG